MTLLEAPRNRALKIVDLIGGEGFRRRLFSLGFHKGDIVEFDSRAILRGPLLVRNVTSDTRVALGRGVAQKIIVEPIHEAE
jgi:Fe2+ transport system protein FeoA